MLTIEQIEKMSIDEVANNYNEVALHTTSSLTTWQQIYFIKKQEQSNEELREINRQMLKYTKAMTILTVIVVIATIVTLAVTVLD